MNCHSVVIGLLIFVIVGCTPISVPEPRCQATLYEFASLTQGLELPANLQEEDAKKSGDEFDVNQYFAVLDHLAPKDGYVLDYVYFYASGDSWPVIYARRETAEPYARHSEYLEETADAESDAEYLRYVETDGSPEGYFEWVVLAVQGGQFYLGWHANYSDHTVLCSREAAERVIAQARDYGCQVTTEREQKALGLDLEPAIEYEGDAVQVRVVTFTKWGGFFEEIYTIGRNSPHLILEHRSEELVPYRCGIMF
jgi:hypothetical protein